ncbi:hypothetical protein [Candidatus Poriferisodalis sp.]
MDLLLSIADPRFSTMVAHFHGQTWNSTTVACPVDVSASALRRVDR